MRNKLLILFAVFAALGVTAFAQTQSGGVDFQPASSSVDNQGIRRYRMGAGDILDVRVFGQPDLNGHYEVDEDGNISSLPFIEDPIPAKCRNEKEVQKIITDAYAKYIIKPRVSVRILERRSRPPAIVFGAVRMPSRVGMNRRLRLHEVLVTAGGVTQNANGTIDILHTEPEMCTEADDVPTAVAVATAVAANHSKESDVAANHSKESDIGILESFKIVDLKGGSAANNPFIRPGDIVIVNEGDPVFITGAVNSPREMVIKDQITLARAIAMAGGPQKLANTSQVLIYRKKEGKIGQDLLKFDYDAIRKGKAPDVLLQAYDIVDVRPAGTFSPRSLGEMLKGMSMGQLGSLPMRIPF
jgi:protein involved in polysaccharide export with SLBB domain